MHPRSRRSGGPESLIMLERAITSGISQYWEGYCSTIRQCKNSFRGLSLEDKKMAAVCHDSLAKECVRICVRTRHQAGRESCGEDSDDSWTVAIELDSDLCITLPDESMRLTAPTISPTKPPCRMIQSNVGEGHGDQRIAIWRLIASTHISRHCDRSRSESEARTRREHSAAFLFQLLWFSRFIFGDGRPSLPACGTYAFALRGSA